MLFRIDEGRCVDCGACRRHCPTVAIPYDEFQHQVVPAKCIGCTICYAVCPADAVVPVPDDTPRPRPNLSWEAMERVRMRVFGLKPSLPSGGG